MEVAGIKLYLLQNLIFLILRILNSNGRDRWNFFLKFFLYSLEPLQFNYSQSFFKLLHVISPTFQKITIGLLPEIDLGLRYAHTIIYKCVFKFLFPISHTSHVFFLAYMWIFFDETSCYTTNPFRT